MRVTVAATALLALTLLLFLPAAWFGLVYEDWRDFGQSVDVSRTWTRMAEQQIRPITQLSRIVDVTLFGIEPWGLHLSSLLWHTLNVGIVLALAWRILPPWGAVAAAGIFAWHPVQVEAVAYVSARSDVLAGFGLLLALWAAADGSLPGAVVGVVFAFLAKETAIVAWGLVLLWATWTRAAFPLRLWWLGGAVGLTFAAGLTWDRIGALSLLVSPGLAGEQLVAVWRLLAFLPLPLGLSIEHDWQALAWLWPSGLAVSALVTAWAVLIGWPQRSWLAFGWLWTLVALSPRLVVPLAEGLHERHLYAVVIGWALCAGAWLSGSARERTLRYGTL